MSKNNTSLQVNMPYVLHYIQALYLPAIFIINFELLTVVAWPKDRGSYTNDHFNRDLTKGSSNKCNIK